MSADSEVERSVLETIRRSSAGDAATRAAKSALRTYGIATAKARPLPDYLIIGSKRGGTTSLHAYLSEHPGALPLFPGAEKIKGTYFFDEGFDHGESWYRSHFPTEATRRRAAGRLGHGVFAGDATPYYLFHPLAPRRAAAMVPDAVVVAVLRDPVERSYSHWKERRNHTEELDFEAALDAEPARTDGEEARIIADPHYISFPHRHQTYLAQSRYAPMLERWFDAYGRDGVIVWAAEDFYADPQGLMDEITDRLSVPRHQIRDASPRNTEPSTDLSPALRRRLLDELGDDIGETERILGRTLPWSHTTDR